MMVAFFDDHRAEYGVEPICEVLPIAPSTYHTHKAHESDPRLVAARAQRDQQLRVEIARVWKENLQVYGVRKVWRQLHREGTVVARCTVARLMSDLGLAGAVRGKRIRTINPADVAERPGDLANRDFTAERPNRRWVSDFTYVATWRGFVYVALVIDVFSRRIVGWRVSSSLRTDLPWMLWSRRSVSARTRKEIVWCTTATAERNICRFAIRSGWRKPGSNPRSGARVTRTTTPWPSR